MCSKCNDRKVGFVDYLKNNTQLNKNTKDVLIACSQCKRIYKFDYPITKKKISILYNIIGIIALIIAYIFGHKYIRFIELILVQFGIDLNGILTLLVRITEYFLWVFAIIIINATILAFIEWKLAISTEVDCQDRVQTDLNKEN
ncbi:hypothetical protein LY28_00324 [Ruminiclostridium sufflavum DSM 19573]|uniref:Uncharacterized protein n=1 Tax=Ruminiclostridium sufflavum DSM 19573 TaxID=1121337 RepID=A0A318YAX6_9FIRM|nr:hypothetical protein [Ruminiclostridium sufflavum]PYG89731.1 hypothetical protein LY28_00324 [Ruminiclostridium sufflavum DSM 19573]